MTEAKNQGSQFSERVILGGNAALGTSAREWVKQITQAIKADDGSLGALACEAWGEGEFESVCVSGIYRRQLFFQIVIPVGVTSGNGIFELTTFPFGAEFAYESLNGRQDDPSMKEGLALFRSLVEAARQTLSPKAARVLPTKVSEPNGRTQN